MIEKISGFIVSCSRTLENNTASEVYYLLHDILGLNSVYVDVFKELSGLVVATFEEDSIEVLNRVETTFQSDPAVLKFALKIVPFHYRTRTSIENLKLLADTLRDYIEDNDTWKIQLRRRHSNLPRDEIINLIANRISRGKVKLSSPNKYVIVEVIGKWSYACVSSKAELSLVKIRDSLIGSQEDNFTF